MATNVRNGLGESYTISTRMLAATAMVIVILTEAITYWGCRLGPQASEPIQERLVSKRASPSQSDEQTHNVLSVPRLQWNSYGIDVRPAKIGSLAQSVTVTGRVSLNEDRIAHIFPMVDGVVDSVSVQLGQDVHAKDQLVVVHSREIGQAKLDMYQAKLQCEMAKVRDRQQAEVSSNSRELLAALRQRRLITEIESSFRSRAMGDFRERLISSYSNYLKSQADLDRLELAAKSGAISSKQLLASQSNRDADLATFQARIEQIEYELTTTSLASTQAVKEAETRVAVAETNLRILGCKESDIQPIDPKAQGESISDYPIRAPFDGTVIKKDVSLGEHLDTNSQILSIADLSTVWITADVYEGNIPLLSSLKDKKVRLKNDAWPDRVFEASVFFTGEIMDESSRTIAMRATADNKDHLLKPGMFVTVELPGPSPLQVLTVPLAAIQEHQSIQFVFVQDTDDSFQRRDVKTGAKNSEEIAILEGLEAGDRVVVNGGFVLKSKMLAGLMGEE